MGNRVEYIPLFHDRFFERFSAQVLIQLSLMRNLSCAASSFSISWDSHLDLVQLLRG